MNVGDEVKWRGQRGKVTWSSTNIVDLTFEDMSPIAYEILAEKARMTAKHYGSTKDVFTFDRGHAILSEMSFFSAATKDQDNKCCCGGDAIGATRPPHYCPKFSETT